jgi:hypothetical protein
LLALLAGRFKKDRFQGKKVCIQMHSDIGWEIPFKFLWKTLEGVFCAAYRRYID